MRRLSWESPKEPHQVVRSPLPEEGGILFTHVAGKSAEAPLKFGPSRQELSTTAQAVDRRMFLLSIKFV
jgi:hypothetical protein